MKVLYVTGDSDYSVLIFEQAGYDKPDKLRELWDKANNHKNKQLSLNIPEEDELVYFTAYEFGDSDSNFIEFLMDKFADYDDLKHHNWYEVD